MSDRKEMKQALKSALIFLFQPKAILFGLSIFFLIFTSAWEQESERQFGCWNCGVETRHALLLLIASTLIFFKRIWSLTVSLLASSKIVYSIGIGIFWNLPIRTDKGNHLNSWEITRESVSWAFEIYPQWFFEWTVALGISIYAITIIIRLIQKHLHNRIT